MELADRQKRLGTETAFEVLARAKALEKKGKDIIHLEIGEPDFNTPPHIIQAAIKALIDGETHYCASAGMQNARECFAAYINNTRKPDYSPDEIVITPGAKPILAFGLLACVDENKEVLYPDPGFPIYASMINYIGAKPVPYRLEEDLDFRIDFDKLTDLISEDTRLIIINSPQNPTGGVLKKDDLKILSDLALKHDLWVISDEVYSYIIYDGIKHESITQFDGMKERTILVDGHSKTYAMTGWRLGFGAMPVEVAEQVGRLCTNVNSCTAPFIQYAGMTAFEGPQDCVRDMVSKFTGRRKLITAALKKIKGIKCRIPKGAFYAFPNISSFGLTSQKMQDYLLDECGVATLAGTSFGQAGEGYIRLSYANSPENIVEAMKRISDGLDKLRKNNKKKKKKKSK